MALPYVWRQVLGQEDVWRHFTTVLENLLVVCNIVHVGGWEQLQAFLSEFAARRPGKAVSASCDSTPAPWVVWCLARLPTVWHNMPSTLSVLRFCCFAKGSAPYHGCLHD